MGCDHILPYYMGYLMGSGVRDTLAALMHTYTVRGFRYSLTSQGLLTLIEELLCVITLPMSLILMQ